MGELWTTAFTLATVIPPTLLYKPFAMWLCHVFHKEVESISPPLYTGDDLRCPVECSGVMCVQLLRIVLKRPCSLYFHHLRILRPPCGGGGENNPVCPSRGGCPNWQHQGLAMSAGSFCVLNSSEVIRWKDLPECPQAVVAAGPPCLPSPWHCKK